MNTYFPTSLLPKLKVVSLDGENKGAVVRVYNAVFDNGEVRLNYIDCKTGKMWHDGITHILQLNKLITYNAYVYAFVKSVFDQIPKTPIQLKY